MRNFTHNNVIDAFGGTVAVARLCDITPQAVSQWRNSGIPKPWEKFLMRVRPELFRDDEAKGQRDA